MEHGFPTIMYYVYYASFDTIKYKTCVYEWCLSYIDSYQQVFITKCNDLKRVPKSKWANILDDCW